MPRALRALVRRRFAPQTERQTSTAGALHDIIASPATPTAFADCRPHSASPPLPPPAPRLSLLCPLLSAPLHLAINPLSWPSSSPACIHTHPGRAHRPPRARDPGLASPHLVSSQSHLGPLGESTALSLARSIDRTPSTYDRPTPRTPSPPPPSSHGNRPEVACAWRLSLPSLPRLVPP